MIIQGSMMLKAIKKQKYKEENIIFSDIGHISAKVAQ
jgi:hypothetical protein